jgi:hypothetical protein
VPYRLLSLLIAVLALPGLLARQASVLVHAHVDGDDAHNHAGMAVRGYIEHGHDHGHRHDVGHHHSHGPAGKLPQEDGQPVENDHPDDSDRHGHNVDRTEPAVRRSLLVDDSGPRLPSPTLAPLPTFARGLEPGIPPELPPGEPDGHPTAHPPRVAARLVQGIGLRI